MAIKVFFFSSFLDIKTLICMQWLVDVHAVLVNNHDKLLQARGVFFSLSLTYQRRGAIICLYEADSSFLLPAL